MKSTDCIKWSGEPGGPAVKATK